MSVQLILMKSGEDVIADVYEMRPDGENGPTGYILRDPQIVKIMKKMEDPEKGPNVLFENWAPLAAERRFLIRESSFITITMPIEALAKHFIERFGETDEQLESASAATQERQGIIKPN